LLAGIGPGDAVTMTRLGRLALSTRDLLNSLAAITDKKKAGFQSLADAWADTANGAGAFDNAAAAAARANRRSADVAHRTLALTQRPRIRVRHVSLDRIYDERSPQFKVDEFVYGRFEIVNVGGSARGQPARMAYPR
jgi:hypothetical protein